MAETPIRLPSSAWFIFRKVRSAMIFFPQFKLDDSWTEVLRGLDAIQPSHGLHGDATPEGYETRNVTTLLKTWFGNLAWALAGLGGGREQSTHRLALYTFGRCVDIA